MSYDEDSDAKDVGSTSRGPFPCIYFVICAETDHHRGAENTEAWNW